MPAASPSRDFHPQIAVVGAGSCGEPLARRAHAVGAALARAGAVLFTGGRGGVMAAASAGAREAGGRVVGILPGADATESPPNGAVEIAVFTGLGQARNQLLALSAHAVIAIGGGWGTLSEIALALKQGRPVASLDSWLPRRPDGRPEPLLVKAESVDHAVTWVLDQARSTRQTPSGAPP